MGVDKDQGQLGVIDIGNINLLSFQKRLISKTLLAPFAVHSLNIKVYD